MWKVWNVQLRVNSAFMDYFFMDLPTICCFFLFLLIFFMHFLMSTGRKKILKLKVVSYKSHDQCILKWRLIYYCFIGDDWGSFHDIFSFFPPSSLKPMKVKLLFLLLLLVNMIIITSVIALHKFRWTFSCLVSSFF